MTSATIKLFLPHGDAKRLRVGEVSNWTGKALAAPRTDLDDLLLREAEVIRDRLKQHNYENNCGAGQCVYDHNYMAAN